MNDIERKIQLEKVFDRKVSLKALKITLISAVIYIGFAISILLIQYYSIPSNVYKGW